jgi:hypothetical protein
MAKCPTCNTPLDDDFVIKAGMSALGKRGKGSSKARPTHQCQKAAKAGWAKRSKKQSDATPTPSDA